ncbi:keratin-associated protein 10-9-like isoform 1 [Planoprotostelium fungivorum]|uniref:Keratin-associated protein 10-9-like isoform 1 n=1 Tax=Planoprotostelium fungivorum TaxID=1890364 RepID=A0A2P6MQJ2_9EUKA|nr:keratin-associated protein 10-9-like isoform 1 [Planoprotostelium fungivorum]
MRPSDIIVKLCYLEVLGLHLKFIFVVGGFGSYRQLTVSSYLLELTVEPIDFGKALPALREDITSSAGHIRIPDVYYYAGVRKESAQGVCEWWISILQKQESWVLLPEHKVTQKIGQQIPQTALAYHTNQAGLDSQFDSVCMNATFGTHPMAMTAANTSALCCLLSEITAPTNLSCNSACPSTWYFNKTSSQCQCLDCIAQNACSNGVRGWDNVCRCDPSNQALQASSYTGEWMLTNDWSNTCANTSLRPYTATARDNLAFCCEDELTLSSCTFQSACEEACKGPYAYNQGHCTCLSCRPREECPSLCPHGICTWSGCTCPPPGSAGDEPFTSDKLVIKGGSSCPDDSIPVSNLDGKAMCCKQLEVGLCAYQNQVERLCPGHYSFDRTRNQYACLQCTDASACQPVCHKGICSWNGCAVNASIPNPLVYSGLNNLVVTGGNYRACSVDSTPYYAPLRNNTPYCCQVSESILGASISLCEQTCGGLYTTSSGGCTCLDCSLQQCSPPCTVGSCTWQGCSCQISGIPPIFPVAVRFLQQTVAYSVSSCPTNTTAYTSISNGAGNCCSVLQALISCTIDQCETLCPGEYSFDSNGCQCLSCSPYVCQQSCTYGICTFGGCTCPITDYSKNFTAQNFVVPAGQDSSCPANTISAYSPAQNDTAKCCRVLGSLTCDLQSRCEHTCEGGQYSWDHGVCQCLQCADHACQPNCTGGTTCTWSGCSASRSDSIIITGANWMARQSNSDTLCFNSTYSAAYTSNLFSTAECCSPNSAPSGINQAQCEEQCAGPYEWVSNQCQCLSCINFPCTPSCDFGICTFSGCRCQYPATNGIITEVHRTYPSPSYDTSCPNGTFAGENYLTGLPQCCHVIETDACGSQDLCERTCPGDYLWSTSTCQCLACQVQTCSTDCPYSRCRWGLLSGYNQRNTEVAYDSNCTIGSAFTWSLKQTAECCNVTASIVRVSVEYCELACRGPYTWSTSTRTCQCLACQTQTCGPLCDRAICAWQGCQYYTLTSPQISNGIIDQFQLLNLYPSRDELCPRGQVAAYPNLGNRTAMCCTVTDRVSCAVAQCQAICPGKYSWNSGVCTCLDCLIYPCDKCRRSVCTWDGCMEPVLAYEGDLSVTEMHFLTHIPGPAANGLNQQLPLNSPCTSLVQGGLNTTKYYSNRNEAGYCCSSDELILGVTQTECENLCGGPYEIGDGRTCRCLQCQQPYHDCKGGIFTFSGCRCDSLSYDDGLYTGLAMLEIAQGRDICPTPSISHSQSANGSLQCCLEVPLRGCQQSSCEKACSGYYRYESSNCVCLDCVDYDCLNSCTLGECTTDGCSCRPRTDNTTSLMYRSMQPRLQSDTVCITGRAYTDPSHVPQCCDSMHTSMVCHSADDCASTCGSDFLFVAINSLCTCLNCTTNTCNQFCPRGDCNLEGCSCKPAAGGVTSLSYRSMYPRTDDPMSCGSISRTYTDDSHIPQCCQKLDTSSMFCMSSADCASSCSSDYTFIASSYHDSPSCTCLNCTSHVCSQYCPLGLCTSDGCVCRPATNSENDVSYASMQPRSGFDSSCHSGKAYEDDNLIASCCKTRQATKMSCGSATDCASTCNSTYYYNYNTGACSCLDCATYTCNSCDGLCTWTEIESNLTSPTSQRIIFIGAPSVINSTADIGLVVFVLSRNGSCHDANFFCRFDDIIVPTYTDDGYTYFCIVPQLELPVTPSVTVDNGNTWVDASQTIHFTDLAMASEVGSEFTIHTSGDNTTLSWSSQADIPLEAIILYQGWTHLNAGADQPALLMGHLQAVAIGLPGSGSITLNNSDYTDESDGGRYTIMLSPVPVNETTRRSLGSLIKKVPPSAVWGLIKASFQAYKDGSSEPYMEFIKKQAKKIVGNKAKEYLGATKSKLGVGVLLGGYLGIKLLPWGFKAYKYTRLAIETAYNAHASLCNWNYCTTALNAYDQACRNYIKCRDDNLGDAACLSICAKKAVKDIKALANNQPVSWDNNFPDYIDHSHDGNPTGLEKDFVNWGVPYFRAAGFLAGGLDTDPFPIQRRSVDYLSDRPCNIPKNYADSPSPLSKPLTSTSGGDPHFISFDNKLFDMQSVGQFLYLSSKTSKTAATTLIQVMTKPWNTKVSGIVGMAFKSIYSSDVVQISSDNTGTYVILNNRTVDAASTVQTRGIKVTATTYSIFFIEMLEGVTITAVTNSAAWSVSITVSVSLQRVQGILGTLPMTCPDGNVITSLEPNQFAPNYALGECWRVTDSDGTSLFTDPTDWKAPRAWIGGGKKRSVSDCSSIKPSDLRAFCEYDQVQDPDLLDTIFETLVSTADIITLSQLIIDCSISPSASSIVFSWSVDAEGISGTRIEYAQSNGDTWLSSQTALYDTHGTVTFNGLPCGQTSVRIAAVVATQGNITSPWTLRSAFLPCPPAPYLASGNQTQTAPNQTSITEPLSPDSTSGRVGIIVGAAVGATIGVIVIVTIAVATFLLVRRRNAAQPEQPMELTCR